MKKKSILLLTLIVIIAVVLNCVAFIGFDISGFGGRFGNYVPVKQGKSDRRGNGYC